MFCELGKIENEVHFLLYCPKYTDISKRYFLIRCLLFVLISLNWMITKNLRQYLLFMKDIGKTCASLNILI